jgi:hypothetical protein
VFPAEAAGLRHTIRVAYAGDARYTPAESAALQVTPTRCRSLPVRVLPVGTATFSMDPALCGAAAGYAGYPDGTEVFVEVTPAPDHRVATKPEGPVLLLASVGPGRQLDVRTEPVTRCATVTVGTESVAPAGGDLRFTTMPDCVVGPHGYDVEGAGAWTPTAGRDATQGRFRIRVGRTPIAADVGYELVPDGPASRVYGIRFQGPGSPRTPVGAIPGRPVTQRLAVSADVDHVVVVGPVCRQVTASGRGPGVVRVDTPQNCQDPDRTGWVDGTPVTVTAGSSGRSYPATWTVDGTTEPADVSVATAADGTVGASSSRTVLAAPTPTAVSASFLTCTELRVEPVGRGSVDRSPGNCPTMPGDYYVPGTSVELKADGWQNPYDLRDIWLFKQWNVGPYVVDHVQVPDHSLTLTMDVDRTLRPLFLPWNRCPTLSVDVAPAGAGTVGATMY